MQGWTWGWLQGGSRFRALLLLFNLVLWLLPRDVLVVTLHGLPDMKVAPCHM